MLRSILIALVVALTLPAAVHAQSVAEQAEIENALRRGQLLYAYDQAAWHGTDEMVKQIAHPETLVGGWIVDGPASAPTLVFVDQDKVEPHAVFVAEFRDNALVSARTVGADSAERTLSLERKAMVAALRKGIQAWRDTKPLYCADRSPNSVVLPPERPGGPYLVYILTPQTENGAYPFGGHFRVEIGPDGSVGASRSFTKSCLTVKEPEGKETATLFVTHLLDPVPTEIHVFSALASHHPVAVGTSSNNMVWMVSGRSIAGQPMPK